MGVILKLFYLVAFIYYASEMIEDNVFCSFVSFFFIFYIFWTLYKDYLASFFNSTSDMWSSYGCSSMYCENDWYDTHSPMEEHYRRYQPSTCTTRHTTTHSDYTSYTSIKTSHEVMKDIVNKIKENGERTTNIISEKWFVEKTEPKSVAKEPLLLPPPSTSSTTTPPPLPPEIKSYNKAIDENPIVIELRERDIKSDGCGDSIIVNSHKLSKDEEIAYKIICGFLKTKTKDKYIDVACILRSFVQLKCWNAFSVTIYLDLTKTQKITDYPLKEIKEELNAAGFTTVTFKMHKRPTLLDYYQANFRAK